MNKFIVRLPKSCQTKKKTDNIDSSGSSSGNREIASPSPASTAVTSSSTTATTKTQMQLDFGQKSLGDSILCKRCGLLYMVHDEDDQRQHAQFCKDTQKPLSLPSLVGHEIVHTQQQKTKESNPFTIIQVTSGQKLHREALKRVIERVEKEVGTSQHFVDDGRTMYLYLNENRQVLGVVVLQQLNESDVHQIYELNELSGLESVKAQSTEAIENHSNKRQRVSNKPYLGIRLIWVHENHHRQGIAHKLLDYARIRFMFGTSFSIDSLAFSQPTEIGFQFAKTYTGKHYVFCYSRD